MTLLSIVIPSHNDIYLHRTIDSLLDNAEGNIEIIPVLDGYTPKGQFRDDPRIKIQRHVVNQGMREAINTGVANSTGEYIMRVDEHVMVGPGYDCILLGGIQDNWIVTPRRFFLDPVKWEVMDKPPVDCEKLVIVEKPNGRRKFSAVIWKSRSKEMEHVPIYESLAMQGSLWVMTRKHWDSVIVRLDSNGYGTHYQDTTEMLFKTWKAGGKLMVNKNTWFAHKHREFNRTHNYPGELADASFKYALDMWEKDYEEVRKRWGI